MKYGKMDRTCRTYYGEDKLLQNYSQETYRRFTLLRRCWEGGIKIGLMWECDVDLFGLWDCDVDSFGLWDCDVDSFGLWDCDVDSFGLWDCDVDSFGLWDCDVDLFGLWDCDVDSFDLWDCDVDSLGPVWDCDVAQLVETVCYKPEGRGFDSRWCDWNFHWLNTSGTSTQHLTEMSARDVCLGIKAAGAQGWQPRHLHVPNVL
jgi:hypothetical protein